MFKVALEKAEEPEIQLPTSVGSLEKQEPSRKISISALLTMPKPLTVFSSVQSLSRVQLFVTHELQHARPPCPSLTSGVYPNSCPLSWWYPTISSSVVPFSSCFHSCPASGSFLMSQFFSSGSQSIGVSASTSVLPMNIQDWFPLGWTGWIALLPKELWRVFSNTIAWKHQYFGTQLSL